MVFGLHHFDLYCVSFASVFDTDTSGAACGRGNGSVCDIFIDSTAPESGGSAAAAYPGDSVWYVLYQINKKDQVAGSTWRTGGPGGQYDRGTAV